MGRISGPEVVPLKNELSRDEIEQGPKVDGQEGFANSASKDNHEFWPSGPASRRTRSGGADGLGEREHAFVEGPADDAAVDGQCRQLIDVLQAPYSARCD